MGCLLSLCAVLAGVWWFYKRKKENLRLAKVAMKCRDGLNAAQWPEEWTYDK